MHSEQPEQGQGWVPADAASRPGAAPEGGNRGAGRRDAALITDAEQSPKQQLASREKRYAIMMGTRVVCLFAAIATYKISLWLMGVFLVGMLVLPWMAVLIANDRPPLKPSMYRRFRGDPGTQPAIEARPHRVIDQ